MARSKSASNFQFVTKIFERLKQLVCAVIPFLAIFAQRFADDLLKLSGRVRDVTRERRLAPSQESKTSLLLVCSPSEWRMPGYHFVKDDAETPDIGAFINLPAARLLRRHVTNGSQYGPEIGLNQR